MKEIPLTRGKVALVDDDDYDFLMETNWCCLNRGYAFRRRKGVPELMHRVVMGAKKGEIVDHINQNKLDNRKSNLRKVSKTQNEANKVLQKNNKSGYKGVSLHKGTGKWQATIGRDGRSVYLGLHKSKNEAARVYNEAAVEMYGEYALLNVIEDDEE